MGHLFQIFSDSSKSSNEVIDVIDVIDMIDVIDVIDVMWCDVMRYFCDTSIHAMSMISHKIGWWDFSWYKWCMW